MERLRREVAEAGGADLDPAERLDLEQLRAYLESALFPFDLLRVQERDPVFYLRAALDGLECLILRAREDAYPWGAITARLGGLVRLTQECRAQVREPVQPAVVVAQEMAEGAWNELEVFASAGAPRSALEAAERARRALGELLDWLDAQPARPFEPMGEEAFGAWLHAEHRLDPDAAPWVDVAWKNVERAEGGLAEEWEKTQEDAPAEPPAHFGRRQVLDHYRQELEHVRQWVVDSGVVTVPEGRLKLVEVPEYLEPLIPGAFYLPPPVFSGERLGHFFIPRIPHRMTAALRRSYYRRIQQKRFRNLAVHEAWPGHHLQFLHAVEHHRPLRNLRDDDVMLEGWALYAEALVQQHGLWDGSSLVAPLHALRFRALRLIVDVGIHTGRLSLEQAVGLLSERLGVSGTGWLEAEVRRYALEPTQAMSYLVGAELIWSLRSEMAELLGPRFRLRDFHDQLLAQGPVPLPLIRRFMLDSVTDRRPRTEA